MNPQMVAIVLAAGTGLSFTLAAIVKAWPGAPAWIKVIQAVLADVFPNLAFQQTRMALRKPIKLPAVGLTTGGAIKTLVLLSVLHGMTACAGVSWNEPVLFGGPSVAPIEEISGKHPTPAIASGFQETVGLGQFDAWSHNWDAIDISALELGGVLLNGAAPAGVLQIGGEIGTLNGIIGLGILCTPYAVNGGGFLQGGNPGVTWAGVFNVQALVSYLAPASRDTLTYTPKLPRGGL